MIPESKSIFKPGVGVNVKSVSYKTSKNAGQYSKMDQPDVVNKKF